MESFGDLHHRIMQKICALMFPESDLQNMLLKPLELLRLLIIKNFFKP